MSNPSPQGLAAFCSLLFCLLVPAAQADSLLNGLAVHTELNQQQFIGGLYTSTLSSDPNEILNSSGNKRLELHVVARRLSSRSLNSMWIEGMAINNPPGLLSAQAENMVAFTNFLDRTLREGDILAIRSTGNTTTVSLNGVTLGSIESEDFFPMILRTWIGAVPLSSDFRDGLLSSGQVDTALRAQYESLQPSEARRQAVARWQEPAEEETDETATSEASSAETEARQAALDSPPDKPVISAPNLIAQPAAEAEPPATETADAEPAVEPPTTSQQPREEPAPAQTPATRTTARASAQQQQTSLASAAEQEEDELLDEEEELEEAGSGPTLTAESLLSRQLYHSSLLRWTYQKIRYPRRAVDRRQEGSIRIAVVIDRQGNVLNTSEVEMSPHNLLNREALRAVERSDPFPPMPDNIPGDSFSFSLPIQFKLPD